MAELLPMDAEHQQAYYELLETTVGESLAYFYACIRFDKPFDMKALPASGSKNKWTTYCNNMKEAYKYLGNPATNDTATGIAKVDAAIAALVPKTGSLSAKHFSNTKNTANNNYNLLGSDTAKTYNYGDTVTGGPNSYTGYHYADTFGGFDVEKWKAKDGVSGNAISAVSVNAATNSVTVTGTANDSYTKMASKNTSTVNNSDNYYLVPVNPSTAYTLKYTGSGTDGAAFIFWLDADFKTINWVSKSGLGEVTWEGTSPANACYMQMSFGVATAGTKTYSNIQLYGVVPAERDYIEVPAVTYHYYYQHILINQLEHHYLHLRYRLNLLQFFEELISLVQYLNFVLQ